MAEVCNSKGQDFATTNTTVHVIVCISRKAEETTKAVQMVSSLGNMLDTQSLSCTRPMLAFKQNLL